jgi:BMFP domain-containing protein YqiC
VFDGENGFAKQKGAAVVDVDGNLTNKGKQLRDFLVRLHDSFERVNQSLKVLNKLELLKPIHFQIQEEVSFKTRQDLFQIDEQKLNGLSAEDLAQLRDAGALPLIYANLLNAHLLPRLSQVVESYAKLKKESSNEIDLQKIFDDVDSDTLKF